MRPQAWNFGPPGRKHSPMAASPLPNREVSSCWEAPEGTPSGLLLAKLQQAADTTLAPVAGKPRHPGAGSTTLLRAGPNGLPWAHRRFVHRCSLCIRAQSKNFANAQQSKRTNCSALSQNKSCKCKGHNTSAHRAHVRVTYSLPRQAPTLFKLTSLWTNLSLRSF